MTISCIREFDSYDLNSNRDEYVHRRPNVVLSYPVTKIIIIIKKCFKIHRYYPDHTPERATTHVKLSMI